MLKDGQATPREWKGLGTALGVIVNVKLLRDFVAPL